MYVRDDKNLTPTQLKRVAENSRGAGSGSHAATGFCVGYGIAGLLVIITLLIATCT